VVILLPTATHIHTKVKTKLIMSWPVVIIPTPFFSHDILAHHHAHHSRSDYKRPCGSEDIFWMKARNMARCAERRQIGRQMVTVIPLLPPTSLWGWGYKKKKQCNLSSPKPAWDGAAAYFVAMFVHKPCQPQAHGPPVDRVLHHQNVILVEIQLPLPLCRTREVGTDEEMVSRDVLYSVIL